MLRTETFADRKFLLLLGVITLVGFLLRLHGLWSESITADEADTLYRIHQSKNLNVLLDTWVRHDGHPPFIHLLEYFWTKLFGISEGAVRFPFVLMGTGAIWFAGRIANKFFGSGAGISTAAAVAFLQLPLMYSQLARPYSPGLFFSMALVWYWSCWIFADKPQRKYLILFVITATGAVYSHYFSLLFAGLVGLAGFFFLRKGMWISYLLAGVCIVLLFLPYIGIFLFQLNAGGVGGPGGWLGKPTPAFFADHIWFIFDSSRIILFSALVLGLSSLIFFFKRPGKFHLLVLFLFLTPLLIGYFYSLKSNPVLQNSVLLFSFPFFIMFLFSWIPPMENYKFGKFGSIGIAFLFLAYVTIYEPFHLTDHFGRLKELVSSATDWQEEYGAKNVDIIYNADIPYFIEYNYGQLGKTPQNILTTVNNGGRDLIELRNMVQNSDAMFFVYGWSTKYSPPEALPIIMEKFPYLIEKKLWFNSAVYLFSKLSAISKEKNENIFNSKNDFSPASTFSVTVTDSTNSHSPEANWSAQCKVELRDSSVLSVLDSMKNVKVPYTYSWRFLKPMNYDAQLDSSCIYSSSLKMKVGDILKNPDNEILFTANIKVEDTSAIAVLVIQFERDGKQLYWNGMESSNQIDPMNIGKWQNIYFGLRLPGDLRKTDTVRFFCYTKNGKPVLLNWLDVKTLKGHSGIYGLRHDFE
ncbi:hypothetical protein BH09BAC5_BH09BAC5_04240 [soil metagenome]